LLSCFITVLAHLEIGSSWKRQGHLAVRARPRAAGYTMVEQGLRSLRGRWRPRQRPRLDEPASAAGS